MPKLEAAENGRASAPLMSRLMASWGTGRRRRRQPFGVPLKELAADVVARVGTLALDHSLRQPTTRLSVAWSYISMLTSDWKPDTSPGCR